MKRLLLVLLVLFAVMLGTTAAGTPVNGDSTVAATTAGINLSHSVQIAPRVLAPPLATLLDARLMRLLVVVLASTWVVTIVERADGDRSVRRSERRLQRGPPLVLAA